MCGAVPATNTYNLTVDRAYLAEGWEGQWPRTSAPWKGDDYRSKPRQLSNRVVISQQIIKGLESSNSVLRPGTLSYVAKPPVNLRNVRCLHFMNQLSATTLDGDEVGRICMSHEVGKRSKILRQPGHRQSVRSEDVDLECVFSVLHVHLPSLT